MGDAAMSFRRMVGKFVNDVAHTVKMRSSLKSTQQGDNEGPVEHIRFSTVTPSACADLCIKPEEVVELYLSERAVRRGEGLAAWGDLTEVHWAYLFACAIAHNLKPYGPGSLADLSSMLRAPTLDCSNYGLLMHYLAEMCLSGRATSSPVFVGWDGGAIGNHQMVLVRCEGRHPDLILDPTLGIAVRASFDHVAAGRPLSSHEIIATNATKQLEAARRHVIGAFVRGDFRPSDLLYYFESLDHLLNRFGSSMDWPTPGAASLRSRSRSAE